MGIATTPVGDDVLQWYKVNFELIGKADAMIAQQLADSKYICEHTGMYMTKLCDEVYNILQKGINTHKGMENQSVLLLGESGSGKTHIIEYCLKKLREVQPSMVVLRAQGSAYEKDIDCLRHLTTQVSDRLAASPNLNGSFEDSMEWVKSVFRDCFKHASIMVLVLEEFEFFCSRARQTLLYNLFNLSQEDGVNICIIGTSSQQTVLDMQFGRGGMEKRIKSRFSMRHLHVKFPTTMGELMEILTARLHLPAKCGLNDTFVNSFNRNLENALWAQAHQWKQHLEVGRPPSWFLARCLPVSALIYELAASSDNSLIKPPPAKRARKSRVGCDCLPSHTENEVTLLLLDSLGLTEHVVLIALYRQRRNRSKTLSTLLHEIRLLHESWGFQTQEYNTDFYSRAFVHLMDLRLIECASNRNELPLLHRPCRNLIEDLYTLCVDELKRGAHRKNPLRNLPDAVQQAVK